MNVSRLASVFLVMVSLSACSLSSGSISGKVLEEGTNEPIPGAIVVVRWIGRTTSGSIFVEARDVCYHVETATTDEKGKYQTKSWSQEQHKDYTLKFDHMLVDAYKRDYGLSQVKPRNDEDVYLAPFKGASEERLKYLKRLDEGNACPDAGDSRKNRLVHQEAIYNEARTIAITEQDNRIVEILLFGIESERFGNVEALKRVGKRGAGDGR